MKKLQINKIGLLLGTSCLGLIINSAYAAPLVGFSNGTIADANDVNANFNELATRINDQGVKTYSWAGYGNSAYSEKVFIRTDSGNNLYNKEVRTFVRTVTSATTGTTVMTRVRSDSTGTNQPRTHKLTFSYDTQGEVRLTNLDNYSNDGSVYSQTTINPGINLRNNAMNVGMLWATAAQTDTAYTVDQGFDTQFIVIDSRTLLAVEDITVRSVNYTNCYKILTNRMGQIMGRHFQRVSWFCPNNVGLVKYIQTKDQGDSIGHQVIEFDPTQSTTTP